MKLTKEQIEKYVGHMCITSQLGYEFEQGEHDVIHYKIFFYLGSLKEMKTLFIPPTKESENVRLAVDLVCFDLVTQRETILSKYNSKCIIIEKL